MSELMKASRRVFSKTRMRRKVLQKLPLPSAIVRRIASAHPTKNSFYTLEDLEKIIPAWFLKSSVRTAQDLLAGEDTLIVRDEVQTGQGSKEEQGETTADIYEIDSSVYEPLFNVLLSRKTSSPDTITSRIESEKLFGHDAVHVRLPDMYQAKGGSRFLAAVIEHFAKDAGADLITFELDDVDDLAEHFMLMKPKSQTEGAHIRKFMARYFGSVGGSVASEDDDDSAHNADVEVRLPSYVQHYLTAFRKESQPV